MTQHSNLTAKHLADVVSRVALDPGTVWLDSSVSIGDRGKHSFLAYSPRIELVYTKNVMTLTQHGAVTHSSATMKTALATLALLVQENDWTAMGGITYEGMLEFLGLASRHHTHFPDLHFFLYDRVDRLDQRGPDDFPVIAEQFVSPKLPARLVRGIDKGLYVDQVAEIKRRIYEGDIYQANLTHRFEVSSSLSPHDVYNSLRTLSPAPYAAFMNFGSYQIISSSPERMFLREGDRISTGPIKGTIRRDHDPHRDAQLTALLQQSEKDRAEHLMIVDLERNDLGRIAQTGTVSVPELFRPEPYSRLIHLVSDVTAQIRPDVSFDTICEALLPGGSITGAPKRAAVEILDAIEETPRGYYTGCLGYLTRDRADFNIAIRTLIHQDGLYHIHAGGGIVADSDPEQEYQELLLKAHNLFRSLGIEQSSLNL